jgi:hypothetical protein
MTDQALAQQNVELNAQAIQGGGIKLQDMQVGLMKDKIALAQQMRMMQLMNGLHFGGGRSPSPDQMSGFLNDLAVIQAESGNPQEAAVTAGHAAEIQSRGADVAYKQYQMQSKRLDTFAGILDSVPDSPQGYHQALKTMLAQYPQAQKDPAFQNLAKTPWRPGLLAQIKDSVTTARDRATSQYRQFQEKQAVQRTKIDEQRIALEKERNQIAKEREIKLKKEGAKPVTAGQLQAISDQATRDFIGADPADIRVRSRPVAEEMLRMIQQQHLTLSEASVRAYQQAKKDGVYNGLRGLKGLKGGNAENPLDLPKTPEGLMQNQWYIVQGKPQLYLAGKFYTKEQLDQLDSENETLDEQ